MEPLADIVRWLRCRDPRAETAPDSPHGMGEALDAAPAWTAARLLVHTLLRLRPCRIEAAPWLRAAGLAAWRGLLRLAGEADADGRRTARLQRLGQLIAERPFGPPVPIAFRLADIAALHQALAAVPGHARIYDIVAEHIGAVHRHELVEDLGPQPGIRARVPRRDGTAVTATAAGLLLQCPPLAPVEAIATPTHWRLVSSGMHLGDAPPNARMRLARIAVLHWVRAWQESPCWLPEGRDPGGLPPGLLRLLAGELAPLCRRMGENANPGIWTRTLAARLRPHLADAPATRFAPDVLAVWRRLGAAAPFPASLGSLGLAVDPAFWTHPWLAADARRLRGAATVVRALSRDPGDDPDEAAEQAQLAAAVLRDGWMAACTPAGHGPPPRALSVTLAHCPGGLPLNGWPITLLRHLELPRPRTTRLELLAALVVARRRAAGHRHGNDRLLLEGDDAGLRDILHAAVAAGTLSGLRRPHRLCERMADWLDYPGHAGSLATLARRSARWHLRHPPGEDLFDEPPPPSAAPLVRLPIVLPAAPAPGVSVRELRTVGDLVEEGACMHHCVASYAARALRGLCHILHIEADGEAATVELDHRLVIAQAKGPGNCRNAATSWAERHLPALLAACKRRGAA